MIPATLEGLPSESFSPKNLSKENPQVRGPTQPGWCKVFTRSPKPLGSAAGRLPEGEERLWGASPETGTREIYREPLACPGHEGGRKIKFPKNLRLSFTQKP